MNAAGMSPAGARAELEHATHRRIVLLLRGWSATDSFTASASPTEPKTSTAGARIGLGRHGRRRRRRRRHRCRGRRRAAPACARGVGKLIVSRSESAAGGSLLGGRRRPAGGDVERRLLLLRDFHARRPGRRRGRPAPGAAERETRRRRGIAKAEMSGSDSAGAGGCDAGVGARPIGFVNWSSSSRPAMWSAAAPPEPRAVGGGGRCRRRGAARPANPLGGVGASASSAVRFSGIAPSVRRGSGGIGTDPGFRSGLMSLHETGSPSARALAAGRRRLERAQVLARRRCSAGPPRAAGSTSCAPSRDPPSAARHRRAGGARSGSRGRARSPPRTWRAPRRAVRSRTAPGRARCSR